jgi:hypothetical protein
LRLRETESLATGAAVAIVALGALATIGEVLAGWLEWILDMRGTRRRAGWMTGVFVVNCVLAAVPVLLVLRAVGIRFFEPSDKAPGP